MSYKEMFNQDKNYQEIINKFKESEKTILDATKTGVVDGVAVVGAINKVSSDLVNDIRNYKENKLKELGQEQQEIQNRYQADVDYTGNKAKQLEVKFSLADDQQLQSMVQELNTDDFLHINLLRMELKKRGLNDLDRAVRNHSISLEGEYSKDARYNEISKEMGVLQTLGTNAVIMDGEYNTIDNLTNNLRKQTLEIAKENQNKKHSDYGKVLQDMKKYTEALSGL